MKTTKQTDAQTPLGGGNYETPLIKVVKINTEGVLCASFEAYEEETLVWE